ncbi:MarR family winged helix-turn-helix transcriptional regulator [Williamsia sp. MIQD14]|uniref:MarR family winged helix-turn-helix transcriptional regulator n=1 Tax=Williamsia sp. MIQD14 TaxID=3425703 RepID=UPI003DA11C49
MADPTPEDPTRWLDSEELEAWMALTTVMMRLPGALSRQLQRDSGLTHFEYLVLGGLSDAPERTLRMSELAEFTQSQLPRLSQVAARMEGRGWLVRRPDPTDGRFTLAELTDAGMAVVVDAAPGHVDAVRRLVLDPLTATQIRHLREIGTRLRASLDAEQHG